MISAKGHFYEISKNKKLIWEDFKGNQHEFNTEEKLDEFVENHMNNWNSSIIMTSTEFVPGKTIKEYKGLVYASSSELAGYQKQQTRLKRNTENVLKELEVEAIKKELTQLLES